MMHFKNNHYGFTFIEVMAALMLIALVITPIMFQQSTIVRSVRSASNAIDAMFSMYSFLYEARSQMQEYTTSFTMHKKIEEKNRELTFTRGPVPKKSVFAREHIYQDQVLMVWKEEGATHQETIVAYVYVRPEEKGAA